MAPAAVLTFAGTAKVFSSSRNDFLFALGTVEIIVGVGCVFGLQLFVHLAFLMFSCFFAYLLGLLLAGETNCNCVAGKGDAYVFAAIDAIALVSLLTNARFRYAEDFQRLYAAILILVIAVLPPFSARLARGIAAFDDIAVLGVGPYVLPTNSEYKHTVELKNNSQSVISVSDVLPSCSCTQVNSEPFELLPNDTKQLPLVIDFNQTFPADVATYKTTLKVGLYDPRGKLIAEPTVFVGTIHRQFTVDNWPRLLQRGSGTFETIEIQHLGENKASNPIDIESDPVDLLSIVREEGKVGVKVARCTSPMQTGRIRFSGSISGIGTESHSVYFTAYAPPPTLELVYDAANCTVETLPSKEFPGINLTNVRAVSRFGAAASEATVESVPAHPESITFDAVDGTLAWKWWLSLPPEYRGDIHQ